jgi:MoaA/NifB/PqqE/SkfB family radical SAM enzyme
MKQMKAYANVGKLRLNMLLRREVITNYPVKAYIEPTLFCNLRCPACPTGLQLGLRPSSTINIDLFKSAIDEVGDYLFELWMYNWGEPLLHRQTPEMIRYARDKNIDKIRLSTNLSLNLTDDYIERLVKSGLTELIVSLDGTSPETYSKYRIKGEFDLVVRNMKRIQETKTRLGMTTPEVVWQFLVFKHNEHEIGQAQAEYRNWGADTLLVFGAEMPEKEYAHGFEPSTIPEYSQYHPDHPLQQKMKQYQESGKPCSWLYGVLLLNPNGKVSSCCSVVNQGDDFADYSPADGFFSAWNSKRFKQARGLFTKRKSGASKDAKQIAKQSAKNTIKEEIVSGSRNTVNLPIFNSPAQAAPVVEALICHSCPIPYRMNEAFETIETTTAELLQQVRQESAIWKKLRPLTAYLLMGMPGGKSLLPRSVFLGARSFRNFARSLAYGRRHSISRAR